MIQCPVCQVSNEPNSQFCRECGNRIDRRNEPRPKLKSPLLSGYEEPETYDEEPNVSKLRGVKPAKPKAPGDKPKLRSPLLAGDEEDESWDNAPEENRKSGSGTGKNKLRSPLLGEGDDDDDDFDSPPSGGMPRIRRKPSPSSALNPSMDNGGQNTGNQGAKGGKPKLRSRLLDTSDYEELDDDWDEDEPKEDAHALRSPLLRARTHQDDKPEKTFPPQPAPVPAPMQAPVPTTPMSPLAQMNPPAAMVPPTQTPMPMHAPQAPQMPPVQQSPTPQVPQSPNSSGVFAQQPSFQPPNLPAPTPEVPNQKPLQMPGQPDENYLPPPIPQREATPAIPHPLSKQAKPLLDSETGPDDRRQTSRRQTNTDRRSRSGLLSAGASDDEDDDYPSNRRQAGPAIGADQLKMVCLASICAVVFKVVYIGYIFMSFGLSPTSLWIILDQLAFIFVCVGLIMYSSQSMSSR